MKTSGASREDWFHSTPILTQSRRIDGHCSFLEVVSQGKDFFLRRFKLSDHSSNVKLINSNHPRYVRNSKHGHAVETISGESGVECAMRMNREFQAFTFFTQRLERRPAAC